MKSIAKGMLLTLLFSCLITGYVNATDEAAAAEDAARKVAATEAAIPKSDPRSKVGTATWDKYTKMMGDPKYSQFAPKDIMVAAGEMEFAKVRGATHRQIQKQKTGTFSTFIKEEYARFYKYRNTISNR